MSDNKKDKGCEPPFWEDISVIFNDFTLEYTPNCPHSPWNFVFRLFLLSLFVGLISTAVGGLPMFIVSLMFGIITAFVIILTTKKSTESKSESKSKSSDSNKSKDWDSYHSLPYITNVDPDGYLSPLSGKGFGGTTEAFVNGGSAPGSVQPRAPSGVVEVDAFPYSGPMLPDYTPPSARNLFMNVLIDEIKYNPGRPEAAPVDNPLVKQTMDDYFRVQWFSDPTDVFGKNQSQRQFVTQPSTTVPNDQGAFADWLYKIPGKTCKEGGREACLAGTDGGPVTWLNQAS
jgi:hypothetical protein